MRPGEEYTRDQCARCWQMTHLADFRANWRVDGPPVPLARPRPAPAVAVPPHRQGGPGTELKKLLASLGITAGGGCGCDDRAAQMDAGGVAWCRRHRAEIVAWLRAAAAERGWWATAKAGALAVASGLAFQFDPMDPAPGLLDLAIRRAEAATAPDPLAGHFNASLAVRDGRLVLASRKGRTNSRLFLTPLADDLTPATSPAPLALTHDLCRAGQEDPRLFAHAGRPHLAFLGVTMERGKVRTHQLVAELGADLRPGRVWAPEFPGRREPMEKNWVYFAGPGGELLSVYTTGPEHVVLAHADGRAAEVARVQSFPWRWGEARGGASPVRVGDEWYHWFHGTERRRDGWVYVAGLYTFSADRPYRPLRYIPEPVITTDTRNDEGKRVVFPCGAVLRGGVWVVSYGWNDLEVRFARFDAVEIESRLVRV